MTIDFDAFASRMDSTPVAIPRYEMQDDLAVCWLIGEPIEIEDVAIVVHGGGAMIGAGYLHFGSSLRSSGRTAVLLFDLRGHGRSAGPRGTAPSTRTVLADITRMITSARERFPTARVHMVGHSSGAGLILNTLTGATPPTVDSVVFVAPEFGPFLPGKRTIPRHPFATSRVWPFVLNAMTGGLLFRQTVAVTLNYPTPMVEHGFIRNYTVAMANALTPRAPVRQLSQLPVSTLILMAGDDEVIPGEPIVEALAAAANPRIVRAVQQGSTHLGILLDDAGRVREWIAAAGNRGCPDPERGT